MVALSSGVPPTYGPLRRVAILSDVHANVPALAAVLAEPDVRAADLIVSCGDLTWGPEPTRTVELVMASGERMVYVRGNADRAVTELAAGRPHGTDREPWMLARHDAGALAFVARFHETLIVDVHGLGAVRCVHGSPRDDTELITTSASPSGACTPPAIPEPIGSRPC